MCAHVVTRVHLLVITACMSPLSCGVNREHVSICFLLLSCETQGLGSGSQSWSLNYLFKNKIYFIFSYVCMRVACAHVSVGACRVQKRVLDILELESTRTHELPCR